MNIQHRLSNWLIKKAVVFAVFLHRGTIAAEQALIAHYRRENMVR